MAPEWDPNKAAANFRKHGIHFSDAVTALEDEGAISVRENRFDEDRWITIGIDSRGRLLVVVYNLAGRQRAIDFRASGGPQGAAPI